VKLKNVLVSLGNDEETLSPTIKLWNLDRFDPETGTPELIRTLRLPQNIMVLSPL